WTSCRTSTGDGFLEPASVSVRPRWRSCCSATSWRRVRTRPQAPAREPPPAGGTPPPAAPAPGGLPGLPHFAPKAKRVIYMFQSGAPSQLDLFDYKPELAKRHGTDLPDSIRNGQRLTAMTAGQTSFPVAESIFKFAQHGKSQAWLSEL